MKDEKYFIGDVTYTSETEPGYTAKTIAMGDGMTGVNTLIFSDRVGVLFHRSDFVKPFDFVEYDEKNKCPQFQGELVTITFDKQESIDAVIKQLLACKENLAK